MGSFEEINDGNGYAAYSSPSWNSFYVDPVNAPSAAYTSKFMPVPAGELGVLRPGDWIGVAGSGGFAVRVAAIAAGGVILGAALAKVTEATKVSKLEEKPCVDIRLFANLSVVPNVKGWRVFVKFGSPDADFVNFLGSVSIVGLPRKVKSVYTWPGGSTGQNADGWNVFGSAGPGDYRGDSVGAPPPGAYWLAQIEKKVGSIDGWTIVTTCTAFFGPKTRNGHDICPPARRQTLTRNFSDFGLWVPANVELLSVL